MGDWQKMVQIQNSFQNLVGMNDMDNVLATKELVLHILSECDELLREIAWKARRRQNAPPVRSNILDEITDLMKLVVAIGCTWGFDHEQMFQAFIEKSDVMEQLYRQEFPLYEIIQSGALVVAIDIDGVLADYPRCFYDWVSLETSITPCDYDSSDPFVAFSGRMTPAELKELKSRYRQSGYKRYLPTVDGAVGFTRRMHELGYKVVLLSSRPVVRYARIFYDTIHWLNENGFHYDAIMWDEEKESRLMNEFRVEQIAAFIDDESRNVELVSGCGIPSHLFSRPYNQDGESFEEIERSLGSVE